MKKYVLTLFCLLFVLLLYDTFHGKYREPYADRPEYFTVKMKNDSLIEVQNVNNMAFKLGDTILAINIDEDWVADSSFGGRDTSFIDYSFDSSTKWVVTIQHGVIQ